MMLVSSLLIAAGWRGKSVILAAVTFCNTLLPLCLCSVARLWCMNTMLRKVAIAACAALVCAVMLSGQALAHTHVHARLGFYYGPYWPGYYYAPYPAYYYPSAAVAVPVSPPVYVEQGAAPSAPPEN